MVKVYLYEIIQNNAKHVNLDPSPRSYVIKVPSEWL